MSDAVQTNATEVANDLASLPADLESEIRAATLRGAVYLLGKVKQKISEVFGGGGPRRTGRLSRSFEIRQTFFSRRLVAVSVGSELIYAGVLEHGTDKPIKPRTVSMLAIPVSDSVVLGQWPRHFGRGELVFVRKPYGGLLFRRGARQRRGRRRLGELMYVLKREVEIEGRHYLRDVSEAESENVARIVAEGIGKAIAKRGG